MKAKIRGIYTTALTKLLLDHDFKIVQPSEEILERFGLEDLGDDPDLSIRDRLDMSGVESIGTKEAVEALSSILREELLDVVVRRKVEGRCLDFYFPWESKIKLDDHRKKVLPTVQKHHYLKASGGYISSAVDMAERLLLKGCELEEVEELLSQTIRFHLPYEGSEVDIEHMKLSGIIFDLGKAMIHSYDESNRLKFVREIRSDGVYDGLEVKKDSGDRAVTRTRLGEYYTETRYYSRQGRFKGAYINLNTPVEPYPSKIRYIDLEVDLCVLPGGEMKLVDMELLERAAEECVITGNLLESIKKKVSELQTSYEIDKIP